MSGSRTVVLTGVTRGLGRAMATELAARGHVVLGCGRTDAAITELRLELGEPHDLAVVDIADDGQVERWARRLIALHGAPDLVLNNAALINASAPLWEVPADAVAELIDVNIGGVINVIRHFVPSMIRCGSGVIVNFSSGWGRSTAPEVATYCASKWAIEGLSRALAQELPSGLATVSFNPGVIHTEMLHSCFGASAASYPSPIEWCGGAVDALLAIGPKDNGRPLSAKR